MAQLQNIDIIDGGALGFPLKQADTVVSYTSTGPASFTVPAGITYIDVLVLAGGGGGGSGTAGGGGAGGLISIPNYPVTPGSTIPLSVGAGATARGVNGGLGVAGQDSTFGTLVAKGGGGGGSGPPGAGGGSSGGSGGAGASYPGWGNSAGLVATQGAQPGQSGVYGIGYPGGGWAFPNINPGSEIGGGGGAGGPGGPKNTGGPGRADSITGSLVFRGGGGGGTAGTNYQGPGGRGGGGGGATVASSGGTNLGGGGGGGWDYGSGSGAAGGPGVVIVRYNPQAGAQNVVGTIRQNQQNGANRTEVWDGTAWRSVPTRIVTFSEVGSANFTVPQGVNSVWVLAVGGGGAGGCGTGGGGGAGGMVEMTNYPVGEGDVIPVVVGQGGGSIVSGNGYNVNNAIWGNPINGTPSKFGQIEAYGGGGGAWSNGSPYGPYGQVGLPGGSGGGGNSYHPSSNGSGSGLQSSFYEGIGQSYYYLGGNPGSTPGQPNSGGGGGGAGAAGSGGPGPSIGGQGGIGKASSITGTAVYYAGGGGGGAGSTGGPAQPQGGGGPGATSATPVASAPALNGVNGLGGGGGGAWNHNSDGVTHQGGSGGSGIVIIRY